MKIISLDIKKGYAKLKIDSAEDMWYLSQIIFPGDYIRARTTRRIERGGKEDRARIVKKESVLLKIEVSKIEFLADANTLKVLGKTAEGYEDIPKGVYHSIRIEENSIIELMKDRFLGYQIKYLKESTKNKRANILICAVDRGSATFALLKNYGYEVLSNIEGEIEKKEPRNVKSGDFYKDLVRSIEDYDSRYKFNKIVIGSPAFWRKSIYELLPKRLAERCIMVSCSDSSEAGINEMLRMTELRKVLSEERIKDEIESVEELLAEIGRSSGKFVYGYEDTKEAIISGAVTKLLITNGLIKTLIEENNFGELNELMKSAESCKAEIIIVNSKHEGGAKLDGLGSIGAILRYKIGSADILL